MIAEDLERIARQERELQYTRFDANSAWQLGCRLRGFALSRGYSVVLEVRRLYQPLFFCALGETTPDNSEWVRRKTNTVARFLRSSYAIGLMLEEKQFNLAEKYALPAADYVSHGGCFPIAVRGAGVIGMATVSGLVQRADHELVVEALCIELGCRYEDFALAATI